MNQQKPHHRRSIRLKNYDYSSPGAYFVTVCAWDRQFLFGQIAGETMRENECGKVVRARWEAIPTHFHSVEPDEFVVMPNHVHGIIMILDRTLDSPCRGTACRAPFTARRAPFTPRHAPSVERFGHPVPASVPTILRSFKSAVTKALNESRGGRVSPVWQPNYYEHVIRDEKELDRIRQYIVFNPQQWAFDRENPAGCPPKHALPWEA